MRSILILGDSNLKQVVPMEMMEDPVRILCIPGATIKIKDDLCWSGETSYACNRRPNLDHLWYKGMKMMSIIIRMNGIYSGWMSLFVFISPSPYKQSFGIYIEIPIYHPSVCP